MAQTRERFTITTTICRRNNWMYAIWHLRLLDLFFRPKSDIHWKQCMHLRWWSVGVIVCGHRVSVGEPEWVGDGLGAIMVTVPFVVGVRPVLDLQCRVPKAGLSECWVLWLRLGEATFIHLHSSVIGKQISATFLDEFSHYCIVNYSHIRVHWSSLYLKSFIFWVVCI